MKKYAILGVVVALVGCGNDPKEANNDNFTAAINGHLTKDKACFSYKGKLPYLAKKGDAPYYEETKLLDAMVELGFLTSVDKSAEVVLNPSRVFGPAKKATMSVREFTLTEDGESVYQEGRIRPVLFGSGSTAMKFCYGNYAVTEIKEFTAPADMLGKRISEVKFTYSIQDVEDWAYTIVGGKEERLEAFNDRLQPKDGKATLVLMSDRWAHSKEI
jgi:hypothetical protein